MTATSAFRRLHSEQDARENVERILVELRKFCPSSPRDGEKFARGLALILESVRSDLAQPLQGRPTLRRRLYGL